MNVYRLIEILLMLCGGFLLGVFHAPLWFVFILVPCCVAFAFVDMRMHEASR